MERHDLIGPASAGLQVDSGEAVQQSSQLLADQVCPASMWLHR
eukprot:COSAG01_NODE_18304_length_1085_cov_39.781947_1_plen_42_part_10